MRCYNLSDCVRQNMSVGVAKYTQNKSEKVHVHDFFEIVYMINGSSTHYINAVPYHLEPGDMLCISPGNSHAIEMHEEVTYMDVYDGSCTELYTAEKQAAFYQFREGMRSQMESLLDSMYVEYTCAPPMYEDMLMHYFELFRLLIRRQCFLIENGTSGLAEKTADNTAFAQKMQQLAHSVRTSPKDALPLSSAAEKLHYSTAYLSRKFNELFGMPYTKYVYTQRFKYAFHLLCTTDDSIDDVLLQSGITDPGRFYRNFKEQYTITPQQYRQLYVNGKVKIQQKTQE